LNASLEEFPQPCNGNMVISWLLDNFYDSKTAHFENPEVLPFHRKHQTERCEYPLIPGNYYYSFCKGFFLTQNTTTDVETNPYLL
jgi:hypothetical protein